MTSLRRHIILATDLSARCDRAFDRAVLLAREWDAHLTVAHALEQEPAGRGLSLRWRGVDCERRDAESQIRADLQRVGVSADVVVRPGSAPLLIAELAKGRPCDLIVAGVSQGSDLIRAIRGSTLEVLARKCIAPVLTVSRPCRGIYEGAVVGTSFSDGSRAALQATLRLFPEAEVTTLHAYRQPRESMAGMRDRDATYQYLVGECTRFVTDAAPGHWRKIRRLTEVGFPETLLKEYAMDRRLDLIAVGLEDRHPLLTLLVGGTINPLIQLSTCDILIVPAKWTPTAGYEQALRGAFAVGGSEVLLSQTPAK
jgi:nucleotide-binding universal stress UspA family protein